MNIEIKIKNIPFAKPERVSMRPYLSQRKGGSDEIEMQHQSNETYPYVNRSLGSQVAITDAHSSFPEYVFAKKT